jgi:hypothetical protein
MKTNYLYICIGLMIVLFSTSCEGFLDTLPDNRTQIDTEKKITQLLVSAYPQANISTIAELSSDNFVDNNAPNAQGKYFYLNSLREMDDQLFAWEPAFASTAQDSPSYIWENCYTAIAAANHALKAIEDLAGADTLLYRAQKGEALLCRAYGHFLLVNIFSQTYKDETASALDMGIPYATKPETVVRGEYTRGTVTDTYAKIQKDIEDGIELINDEIYSIPKYHFNKKAAYAFAARFYLYKREYDKVLKYANEVLGSNPATLLRNWDKKYSSSSEIAYDYIDVNHPCNLMILPTNSIYNRVYGTRYGHNGDAMNGSTYGSGPTWAGMIPAFLGKVYIRNSQDYGVFLPKNSEMFEYTDKVANIGLPHIVRAEFTAEETLLCRAEALVYLNRLPEAMADLESWNTSHLVTNRLTNTIIKSFYMPTNKLFVKKLNPTLISSNFTISADQEPYIHCVLHFRRIETLFDGLRWFDLKRYGIEITHKIGRTRVENLLINDPRRAIQIPQEVIGAGMEENPTINTNVSNTDVLAQ